MAPGVLPGRLGHRYLPWRGGTVGGRVKEPELSPPLSMLPTKPINRSYSACPRTLAGAMVGNAQ